MSTSEAEPITWSLGPANSRLLRGLLYLLVALLGGWAVLPLTLGALGVLVGSFAASDLMWLAPLWLLPILLFIIVNRAVLRRDPRWARDDLTREFLAATNPIVLVVVAIVGSLGIVLVLEAGVGKAVFGFEVHELLLTLWAGTVFGVFFLTVGVGTQAGRLDPSDRTLRLSHGIGETVLDLEYLTDVASLPIGQQTVFRVRVTRESGPFRTHYLLLPTDAADRAAEVFDECLQTPAERESADPTIAIIAKWSARIGTGITVSLAALLVVADVPLPLVVTTVALFGTISLAIWVGVSEY